jgi:hypothetical protein
MDDSSVKALSDKTIYRIVGEALERAELLMRKKGMSNDAETFAQASTHWLRHTFGRHAVAGGVQANIVQAVLGHASLVHDHALYECQDRRGGQTGDSCDAEPASEAVERGGSAPNDRLCSGKICHKLRARLCALLPRGLTRPCTPRLTKRTVVYGVEPELIVQLGHQLYGLREVT